MRLALFTDTIADVNGVARFVATLAEHAHGREWALRVFTSTHKPVAGLPNVENVSPVVRPGVPRYPQLAPGWPWPGEIFKAVDRFGATHVHVSTPGPVGLIGRWYAMRRGLPLVCTHHTDFPLYVERIFGHETLTAMAGWYLRWFYGPARRVLARSSSHVGQLAEMGVSGERVAVLRAGIDTGLFNAVGRAVRRDERVLRCLYVGRLSVEKNLGFLVEVWCAARRALAARGVEGRLRVVGEGPFEGAMRERLGGEVVEFAGVVRGEALAEVYRSADVFLFPSETDTLGQVVMEAQACGVVCIVSPVGGPATVVQDGVTALVVPVEREAWVEAVCGLACEPGRLKRISVAAAQHGQGMRFGATFDSFIEAHGG